MHTNWRSCKWFLVIVLRVCVYVWIRYNFAIEANNECLNGIFFSCQWENIPCTHIVLIKIEICMHTTEWSGNISTSDQRRNKNEEREENESKSWNHHIKHIWNEFETVYDANLNTNIIHVECFLCISAQQWTAFECGYNEWFSDGEDLVDLHKHNGYLNFHFFDSNLRSISLWEHSSYRRDETRINMDGHRTNVTENGDFHCLVFPGAINLTQCFQCVLYGSACT